MKHAAALVATLLLGLGMAPSSWAIMVGTTDVGSVDTLIAQANLQNSGTAEINFIQQYLGSTATILDQVQNVSYQTTDTANVFAFQLDPIGDYFLVKNAQWTALFQNVPNMSWAVFNTTLLNEGFNLNGEGTISHIRVINPSTNVPEPATLGLFGLGLIAAGAARRRRTM